MSLPSDIQYMIIKFVPHSSLMTVCRKWNNEIKNNRKNAAKAIGSWYKKRVFEHTYTCRFVQKLVREIIIYCPNEFFIIYPEFTVRKLNLEEELLSTLPTPRKRSDVRNWMLNMPISLHEWRYVGL